MGKREIRVSNPESLAVLLPAFDELKAQHGLSSDAAVIEFLLNERSKQQITVCTQRAELLSKIDSVVKAQMMKNQGDDPLAKRFICTAWVQKETGFFFNAIAQYFGLHQSEIDLHNQEYRLEKGYNRRIVNEKKRQNKQSAAYDDD